MSSVALFGELSQGHGCFPPTENISASADVFIEGRGAVRFGDSYIIHCCDETCHPSRIIVTGSSNVFVNGRALARSGDSISCGDSVLGTSKKVYCN